MSASPSHDHYPLSRISLSAFRAAYMAGDRYADIAKRFNICTRTVYKRARAENFPPRGNVGRAHQVSRQDQTIFSEMWLAGVGLPEMATFFGVDSKTVQNTRTRLDLPRRRQGVRPKMTVAQFFEDKLRQRMEQTAMLDQSAFINAEMVDRIGHAKIKHVGVVR